MSISLAELPSAYTGGSDENLYSQICLLPQPEPLSLKLYLPSSLRRRAVESFIFRQFRLKHGASIRHFMPYLISLEEMRGGVLSAAGFRPACENRLFLEKYLDIPVEKAISLHTSEQIERLSVIEVGNLASDCPGSSRLLIMAMTYLFNQQGFEWVTMTGTNDLINIFRNLQLNIFFLGRADAKRLANEQNDWGRYYTHNPQVMAGSISDGHHQLSKSAHYLTFISSLHTFNLPPCSNSG